MRPNGPGPFAELLIRHRLALSYSQARLAEEAALSLRGVSDLERGVRLKPRPETVRVLADALGLIGAERAAFLAAAQGSDQETPPHPEVPSGPNNISPFKLRAPHPHNVPAPATPLVGREREVSGVRILLRRDAVHLVTLTGPGGVGKTRLATHVALALLDAFPDGVWFVPLSRLTDPKLVVPAIAQVLHLHETGATPIAQVVRWYLREKHLLLVLDNFEHLLAAAPDIAGMTAECPHVKVLVTSRTPLQLSQWERTYPLQPLALPDPAHMPAADRILRYPGVTLFVARAKAARADIDLSSADAPTVARICAHLDGLPLAIELAAARMSVLSPAALLKRLGRRLPLLTHAASGVDERHQTMRHALAWSYALLAPAEQRLFRRLGVFAGSCTLEAVEAICAAPGTSEPLGAELLDGLGVLVAHSLLRRRDEADSVRFSMLHVVREYAQELLEGTGEATDVRLAHARWCLAYAAGAQRSMRADPAHEAMWLDHLDVEQDNVRAALAWTIEHERADLAVQFASALGRYWWVRGHYRDGLNWFERIMGLPKVAPLLRAVSENPSSVPAFMRDTGTDRTLDTLALTDIATALNDGLRFPTELDRLVQYEHWVRASLTLSRQAGSGENEVRALVFYAFLAIEQHRPLAEATQYLRRALRRARALGDPGLMGLCLSNLGKFARTSGDFAGAEAYLNDALAWQRRNGVPHGIARQLTSLAQLAADQGDFQRAGALARESLAVLRTTKDPSMMAEILVVLALSVAETRDAHAGARLLGAAAAASEAVGESLSDEDASRIATATRHLRRALGEIRWAAAFDQGRRLSLEEAIMVLRDEHRSVRSTAHHPARELPPMGHDG